MYNSDTEMLFPPRVIPSLGGLRGEGWRAMVERLAALKPVERDLLAFVLLMVRLGGCANCNADSFRAMRGCTQCARQTVRRFRGDDKDLEILFAGAREEIDRYLDGPITGNG